jgi:glucosyl-dolichyl phosphate glucuronosyltransferase
MKVTVILCTYNRCESLSKALESVAASSVPASVDWDVLVVDNNSRDQTRAVVEGYCRRYPNRFGYLFEPQQGKSYALNSGIRASNADVLAFMDDDVEVDANWLYNLTASLDGGQVWSGAGGRILPEMGFIPPPWLDSGTRYALAPLAMFDLGASACELREAPFGTNMAFRREMFSKHGDFRTDLGPRPGSEIRNEDVEFGNRLLVAGERFWYEPSAVVYHSVPPNRLNKTYFLAWWFDKGRADLRQNGRPEANWYIGGIPIYLIRRLCVWSLRWVCNIDPRRRFTCKLKVLGLAGEIAESRAQRRIPEALPPGIFAPQHSQGPERANQTK